MKKITIFTVSLYDNNYLNTQLHQFCINSWNKYKKQIESQGYECEIKIFDYDSEEVIEFKKDCEKHLKSKSISIQSDAFKIYILSKYKNHIWMDCDVYCRDDIKFDDFPFFRRAFQYVYNGECTEFFKAIYERYKNGEFVDLYDKDVFKRIGIQNRPSYEGTEHLHLIDNMDVICFTDDENIINKFLNSKTIALVSSVKIHNSKNMFFYDKTNQEHLKLLEFIKSLKGKSIIK